ncbi:Lug1p NDAI_0A03390 [Naumovozyma dairenensis CBS 421]|uniref:Uncharacterized protein n=1 Tax=Naumovozyma dairenensis (strain ATCC 10597 / BCRC 20456 / CBS 421 / NBRC 0211 / NRRL Y-12639) TaxID=1071378 RepID=G0W3V8_NAUDC|nr:hypothetical protein NDAI_0A03390 [Naumovozyma dairenensis CBS 421]CCD22496.1 hypothetical protein NDAI_0A03390 [Naumovozyma dairenensis CBS 421]
MTTVSPVDCTPSSIMSRPALSTGEPSSLTKLPSNIPPEIVYQILTYQFNDFMNNDHPGTSEKFHENIRNFLRSNLTVNKTFYHICKILIYKYCNFTTAKRFHHLLKTIEVHKEIRNIIQVADFEELTSIGLGRSSEMNKTIKNLTNETLLKFLLLTKSNLREFLACEQIQDDLDDKIIHFLLKPGKNLSVLDFCGCSGPSFTTSFIEALERLYPKRRQALTSEDEEQIEIEMRNHQPLEYNYQITCLGLNDCTDLPSFVLGRVLKMLPELQKLDLSHTSIDGDTLLNGIPHYKNLTHLSLASCLQLTPRSILEFFSSHPCITDENNSATLEWLNLHGVSNHSSTWNDVHTMFLLKKLCQHGHNKTLQYLNIGGLPLHQTNFVTTYKKVNNNYYYHCTDTLQFIKLNFPNLKSLSIKGNNIPISKLVEFLSPIQYEDPDNFNFESMNSNNNYLNFPKKKLKEQHLKFLNISNNNQINKWTIQDPAIFTCSSSIVAFEISFEAWQQIEKANPNHELITMKYNNDPNKKNTIIQDASNAELLKWQCYIDSSYGRRYWIYKTDPYLNCPDLHIRSGITNYDSEGHKIIEIIKQPDFLKFAQSKIMLGCGIVSQSNIRRELSYRDFKPPISQFFTRNGGISFGETPRPIITPRLPPGGWRIINDEHNDEFNNRRIDDRHPTRPPASSFNSSSTLHTINERPPLPTEDYIINDEIANENDSAMEDDGDDDAELRNALYWDRSLQDLQALSLRTAQYQENDEEYLNNPELQRRRSQLSLLRQHSSSKIWSTTNNNNINNNNNTQIVNNFLNHRPPISASSSTMSLLPLEAKQKIKLKNEYYYAHPDDFVYDKNDPMTSERYRMHFKLVNEYKVFGTIERGMYRYYSLKT